MAKSLPAQIVLAILVMTGVLAARQESVAAITGTVVDRATARPLEGVNLIVAGTAFGDATDAAGHFVIEGSFSPDGSGIVRLLVSAIGFEERRLAVQLPQTEPLEIALRETFFQMDELVVTGTRTAKLLVNAPIATEVITRQDILDSGARDMSELLEQRSGVVITPNVEGGLTASLLGIDSKYILILVDGQPVTGKFNGRIALDQISTAVVDKVEIIKGPSSAVYGSEAMGGVINIITINDAARPHFTARTRYSGSDDALNPLNGNHGKRDLRINLDRALGQARIQLDADALKANVDKSIKYIDIDDFTNLSLRGSIDWTLSATHSLGARITRFSTEELSRLAGLTSVRTLINRTGGDLEHRWQVSPAWQLQSIGRYSSYVRDFSRPLHGDRNLTEESEAEAELNVVYRSPSLTLNSGSEIGRSTYSNERVAGGSRKRLTTSFYAQAEWQPADAVTMVLGGRIDNNDDISPVTSPRLAVMVKWRERWKWRTAWGMGFRMPSFMDQYIDWSHVQYGYAIIGNPDLKTERSNGINTSVEYYHPGKYQVTIALYWNRFENMIEDVLLEPGLFTYANIEQVDFRGMELQARWHLSPNWLVSWGYNFVSNRNLTSNQPVPNTQPHTASFRLSHKHGGGRFGYALKAKVVGPYKPVGYDPDTQVFVEAASALKTSLILDWDSHLKVASWITIAGGLRNLLDYTHDEFGPFVGRTFYVELESKIK